MASVKTNRYSVLAAGAMIQLCIGIIYMWSVFQKYVVASFGWEDAQVSLTPSVMLGFFVIGILIGGRIQDKTNPRSAVIIGTVAFCTGMLVTSFLPNDYPWLLYITYGIIGGFGVGVAYTSTLTCSQKWFPDKRGFATGMIVCAFGFSLVVFTFVAEALLSNLGAIVTFRIFAALFFVICISASFFIKNPPQGYLPEGFTPSQAKAVDGKQYTTGEMLKTPQFYLITLSLMLATPAYFILNPLLKTMGVERGLSNNLALTGVMITGIASACGRLVAPWLSDKLGRKITILILIAITTVAALILISAKSILFLVLIAFIAFAYGGYSGVYPALTADFFGLKNAGANYGCVMLGFGTSAIVFPFIAKYLRTSKEISNGLQISFAIAAGACIIAVILVAMIKKRNEASNQNKELNM